MSAELTTTTPRVPDLVQTPAVTIEASDVATPKIYLGQYISKAVQDGLAKAGDIYSASGPDDAEPIVLKQPVRFYVLQLRKGKSLQSDGELQVWRFDDPEAPPEASTTYTYTVAVPSADEELPFRLLFKRASKPAALLINTAILRNSAAGPSWQLAFSLSTAVRENAKGKFYVPRITTVEPVKAELAVAEKLALMISTPTAQSQQPSDAPAI